MYNYIKHYSIRSPAPQRSNDALMRELIDWAQKRKARSVTEVLGAEIIIPQRSLAALINDETAMGLLQKEAEIQMDLVSKPSDPIELSNQLDAKFLYSCAKRDTMYDL